MIWKFLIAVDTVEFTSSTMGFTFIRRESESERE